MTTPGADDGTAMNGTNDKNETKGTEAVVVLTGSEGVSGRGFPLVHFLSQP
jgi:hypothetical protein